jgi:hypothetical protein
MPFAVLSRKLEMHLFRHLNANVILYSMVKSAKLTQRKTFHKHIGAVSPCFLDTTHVVLRVHLRVDAEHGLYVQL